MRNAGKAVLFFLLLMKISSYAQTPDLGKGETYAPQVGAESTPQGASKLYNTDLYTGTTSFSIPFYDYSIDGLNLGVSIGYNASGIKVDQIASTVGLGWNLNAVPTIERVTNGIEDEITFSTSGLPDIKGDWVYGADVNNKNHDVFIANIGGRQIKFSILFTATYQYCTDCIRVATSPRSEVRVQVYIQGAPGNPPTELTRMINWTFDPSVLFFVITDEKGNKFYFDQADDVLREYDKPSYGILSSSPRVKWYATKIKTSSGAEIKYTYAQTPEFSYDQYFNEKVIEQFPKEINGYRAYGSKPYFEKHKVEQWQGHFSTVSKIEYPNGVTVDFIPETTYSRYDVPLMPILRKINISSGYGSNYKNTISYQLNPYYTYAGGSNRSLSDANLYIPTNYRLMLDNITRSVNGGANEKYYSFTYESTALPPRLSPSQDYYGYFNNQAPVPIPSAYYDSAAGDGVRFSVPKHTFNWADPLSVPSGYLSSLSVTYGVDKTPNLTYMKAGSLKTITNNKGGTMEIFYDAHELADSVTATYRNTEDIGTNTFDGLRTEKIEYHDNISPDNNTVTSYTYEGGTRFYKSLYFWYPTELPDLYTDAFVVQRRWHNQPVHQMELYNGFNHGYSRVTVTQQGFNNEVLSKSKYFFSNIRNWEIAPFNGFSRLKNTKTYNYQLTDVSLLLDHEMGILLKEEQYAGNGNNPVSRTVNEYENRIWVESDTLIPWATRRVTHVKASTFSASRLHTLGWVQAGTVGEHVFENNLYRLKKSTTTNFSGTTQSQQVTEYIYDDNDNLYQTKWKDSKGVDYTRTTMFKGNAPIQLQSSDVVTTPGITNAVSATGFVYDNFTADRYRVVSKNSAKQASPGVDYIRIEEYTAFDSKNNVTEIKMDSTAQYAAQLWDTRIGQKIATATNARLADIAYTSFEGYTTGTTYSTYDMGNWENVNVADIVTAASTSGLGNTMTGRNCLELKGSSSVRKTLVPSTSYYLTFWANGTPVVKDNGTNVTMQPLMTIGQWVLYGCDIAGIPFSPSPTRTVAIELLTPISTITYIDEVRIHPADAEMKTYTYEPLFGVSSVSDAQNNIIYTQYDEQGRPWRTKDVDGSIITQISNIVQGNNN